MPLVDQILPPAGLVRKLALRSILFATGDGIFLAGNAVFFTQIVGLRASQVGLGMSIASLVSLALSVPLGRAADAFGPKRMWAGAAFMSAATYLAYPLVRGFWPFVAVLVFLEIVDSVGSAGRNAYTLHVFPREERVASLAYMRAALNVGFTAGALISGAALATNSNRVIEFIPMVTAVIFLADALLVSTLPRAAHHDEAVARSGTARGPRALANRGFLGLSILNGLMSTYGVVLTVVIPLWLVEQTDAPRWTLAWLFGTNTVMAVLLQVAAARGSNTVDGALRATRLAAVSFTITCLIALTTHDTIGWVTIGLLWLGHISLTGTELWQSAAAWGFAAELSDPQRRGEYMGVWRIGNNLNNVVGPAVFTWLAIDHGTIGWLMMAGLILLATVLMHPAARAAARFTSRFAVPVEG